MTLPNKLKKVKLYLRKTLALTLIGGLLLTSYGINLQFGTALAQSANFQQVQTVKNDADCNINRGLTPSLIQRRGNAGTEFWLKNCGPANDTASAEIFSFTCPLTGGESCALNQALRREVQSNLAPGEYAHFMVDSPNASCGTMQTDIHVTTSSGVHRAGHFFDTKQNCNQPNTPTPSPAASYTPQPSITPSPSATQPTTMMPTAISTPVQTPQPTMTTQPAPTLTPTNSPHPSHSPIPTTPSRSVSFQLREVNNSGQSGIAMIKDIGNNQIEVQLRLQGENYNNQPAHVHAGTCTAPGQIIYPLSNVVNGYSSTIINISYDILEQQRVGNNAIIEAHRSTTDLTPTVCGPDSSGSPTPQPTTTSTALPSSTPAPTSIATHSSTPQSTPTVSPTPAPVGNSRIAFCMYNDKNANGILEQGEDKISWEFNYKINSNTSNSVSANWWNFLSDGCANIEIGKNAQISVDEETRSGWSNTAIWENGRKTNSAGEAYTFTATADEYQIWFLSTPNTTSPSPTPTVSALPTSTATGIPTTTPAATVTITPTSTPSSTTHPTNTPTQTPTPIPTATPQATASPAATSTTTPLPTNIPPYDIQINKTVDGAEVRGDNVGIQYRIRIRNNADRDLTVRVIDDLERTFTYDQNTTSGDVTSNPLLEDIDGDDNRRVVWNTIALARGQEKTFTFRTTGRYEDRQFCNNARLEAEGSSHSESRACVRVNRTQGQVLAATTQDQAIGGANQLPATGGMSIVMGIGLITLSIVGFKLAKYGDQI